MARRATLSVTYDKSSKFYSMFGMVVKCQLEIHLVEDCLYLTVEGRIETRIETRLKSAKSSKLELLKKARLVQTLAPLRCEGKDGIKFCHLATLFAE